MTSRESFLIIQTAFTGDVILATSVLEKIHTQHPGSILDILVRKGNESLFEKHPFVRNVLIWNKQENKYRNLFSLLKEIRSEKYNSIINLQRFAATGFLTAFSKAKNKTGFRKNPFSVFFSKSISHSVNDCKHEIERNQLAIDDITSGDAAKPLLYPSADDFKIVHPFKSKRYCTISPVSAWYTKTLPAYKWVELINKLPAEELIYLLGSKAEFDQAEKIKENSENKNVINLCGKLSFLQSAALMKDAINNYVNDSAPMHLASAVNAPVTAVYCSTIPGFGFGPLSDSSQIVQTKIKLECKPCGVHGYRQCPLTHFKCAHTIDVSDLLLQS